MFRRITLFILISTITTFFYESPAQKLEKLSSAINTEFNELHPLIAADGKSLYIVRENHPSNSSGKEGSSDVWITELQRDDRWAIARRMPNSINKGRYNDIFSITPDGTSMLVRGAYDNGKKLNEVGISICKQTATGWSQPQKVEIPKLDLMVKGPYLSAYLSNNGKVLLLAFSEKKNSVKDDLYVSFLSKTGWSKPQALGIDVNTEDAETTPFLASDNATLYFASDRKDGVGGMDIWVTKRLNRYWTKWSKPVNLGKIINSEKDDFYYSIAANGQYAYMTTRNEAIGEGDIVRFKLFDDSPVAAPTVASTQTPTDDDKTKENNLENTSIGSTTPTPVVLLSGKVIDEKTGKPIEAKIIYETLPDGEEAGIAYTNPKTGEYKIVLPYGTRYSVRAEAKDFIAISKNIDLTQGGSYKEITGEELKLVPIVAGASITLNNIFFEFGKSNLRDDSFPELNRLVDIMNSLPTLVVEIQGHTDNVGSNESNLKLSQERADAVRSYLVSKKIADARVRSVGFGETRPIAPNATPEGQAQNRRVEFVIVRK